MLPIEFRHQRPGLALGFVAAQAAVKFHDRGAFFAIRRSNLSNAIIRPGSRLDCVKKILGYVSNVVRGVAGLSRAHGARVPNASALSRAFLLVASNRASPFSNDVRRLRAACLTTRSFSFGTNGSRLRGAFLDFAARAAP